ncbi:MAG TPA: hypothetical protein VF543_15595 [Pyrinomonadaceae bacterium]
MNSKRIYASVLAATSVLTILTFLGDSAAQTQPTLTVVEQSQSLPAPRPGTLGTTSYKLTEKEAPFFSKLTPSEQTTGSILGGYSINGKKGVYVGWFGIVRKIEEDSKLQQTKLLVEHKYFDGLTDTHIMALSFNGGGDFTSILAGTNLGIKSLSLVKVYGTVMSEDNSVPTVHADYVRQWDWGQFTFLDVYGTQKGNKQWKKLNKVNEDKIYNPFPDRKYYEDRLGVRKQ